MAPLRPEDIQRPGVARPRGVSARPSTVQLPRIQQPQAGAISDVAAATRRKGAEVDRLAQRRRNAGREQANALNELASEQSQAGLRIAQAQEQFGKALGGVARTFALLEQQRQEPKDRTFSDRLDLERSKSFATIEAEHLNSPREGAGYIQELDAKLEAASQADYDRVKAELGYEPSDDAKADIVSNGFDLRAGAARRTAVAANNARVTNLVTVSDANVLDIARTAGGSGNLLLGIQQADQAVAALEGVLPQDKLEARRQAARETVVQSVVLGHLERAQAADDPEMVKARLITDDLTGFAGEKATEVHAAIVDAAKESGVDPALLLAISRRETAGTFDPQSKTWIDKKTGKRASSASGLFHMIDATRRAYVQPGDDPEDFRVQANGGARLTADNIRGLKRALGTEPTAGEVYLAHVLGLGKAAAVITADPEAKLSDVLSAKDIANSAPHLKGKTVADMIVWSTSEMQISMEAVASEGLIEGRDISAREAGIPLDASVRLSAAVAAKEKQLLAEEKKARKEFTEAFSPLKPRKDRDPAGWVFKHGSSDVSRATLIAEKVLADPDAAPEVKGKAWQRALDMNLEEQMALGLSEREAKVLPNDQARSLANRLQEAKGPDAVAMFYQTRDLAGTHFDKMFGELMDQGLPTKYQFLGMLDPIGSPAQVNAVARVLNIDRKELKADLGPDSNADVTSLFEGVEDDYSEFRQAFEFGPFGAGTKTVTAGIIEAAKDVALGHFRATGDLGEAREMARSLIEDHIEIVVGSNLNAVVPRETGISAADIEDATAFMQTRAQIDLFEPVTIGAAEAELPGELGDQQAEFRRNRTRNAAKNYGVWVTNETGDGLVLVLPAVHGSTSHIVLRNEAGDPYEIKFADVPELAEKGRVAFAPIEGEAPQVRPEVPFIEGGLVP